jgi:hypothetical protein
LWGEPVRRITGPLPEQAEHPRELGNGLVSGLLHGLKGLPCTLGRTVEERLGDTGLHDHHAHAVRHDVVQLAGDPPSFGGERSGHFGLAVCLESVGTVGRLPRALLSLLQDLTGDHQPGRGDDRERDVACRARRRRLQHHHRDRRTDDHRTDQGEPTATPPRDRVRRDQQRHEVPPQREGQRPEQLRYGDSSGDDAQGREGPAPPPRERQGRDRDDHAGCELGAVVGGVVDVLAQVELPGHG